jgi:hypothetical protein
VGWSAEFVYNRTNPFGQCGQLYLLALGNRESSALAYLEEKESITDVASGTNHNFVGV